MLTTNYDMLCEEISLLVASIICSNLKESDKFRSFVAVIQEIKLSFVRNKSYLIYIYFLKGSHILLFLKGI